MLQREREGQRETVRMRDGKENRRRRERENEKKSVSKEGLVPCRQERQSP